MKKIILKLWYSPGDILAFTAAVKSLYEYLRFQSTPLNDIDVFTPYPEIFIGNPYITKNNDKGEEIELDYLHEFRFSRDSGIHVTKAFVDAINRKLNTNIYYSYLHPTIFLTEKEKDRDYVLNEYGIKDRFWLFNAGIKQDIPLKAYPPLFWQAVINRLQDLGITLIQVGSKNHIHPYFGTVQSLMGRTEDIRKYLVLCYHAEGHISHVSFPMHVMGAYRKPCVVIAGGRENPRWEMYPEHSFLHTVGMLRCCRYDGCWFKKKQECLDIANIGYVECPRCMTLIDPNDVVSAVLNYEEMLKGEK